MRRIFTLARKDLLETRRDRLALIFTVVMPVAFTAFFGLLFGGGSDRLPLAVWSGDAGPVATQLISQLQKSDVVVVHRVSRSRRPSRTSPTTRWRRRWRSRRGSPPRWRPASRPRSPSSACPAHLARRRRRPRSRRSPGKAVAAEQAARAAAPRNGRRALPQAPGRHRRPPSWRPAPSPLRRSPTRRRRSRWSRPARPPVRCRRASSSARRACSSTSSSSVSRPPASR